jgi:hypothetical protein
MAGNLPLIRMPEAIKLCLRHLDTAHQHCRTQRLGVGFSKAFKRAPFVPIGMPSSLSLDERGCRDASCLQVSLKRLIFDVQLMVNARIRRLIAGRNVLQSIFGWFGTGETLLQRRGGWGSGTGHWHNTEHQHERG